MSAPVANASPAVASMPPAAKKFLAKVARAVKSAGVPRFARKIFGRAPVAARRRLSGGVQDRDRQLCQMRKFARAGQRVASRCDRGLPGGTNGRDFLLDHSLLERRDRTTCRFDLLKQRPCRAAELTGEVAHGPGTRGGVGDLGEVRLFEQDELRVAREPPGEAVGKPKRGGERQHGGGIGAAEPGGK